MIGETLVWQHVLPAACLAAAQADADALSDCPNYWVPREVVEGAAPAQTAAEQVVVQLFRRLVADRLAPHADAWTGAEYWCQIYEGGRGLGFHFDKDEQAMKEEKRMATPLFSSVYYLSGSQEDAVRQAPTVLIEQAWDYQQGCPQPEQPGWSTFVFPVANQYCLFDGTQAHGVLEAVPLPGRPRRVAFLVNWWAQQPQNVVRATVEDVEAGRLAAAGDQLGSSGSGSGGGSDEDGPAIESVEIAAVDAPAMQSGNVLPVDELLELFQLSITGSGARSAVTVRHPGLTLYPLDEQQVDPEQPLHVLAALLPTADLEAGSDEESGSSSGSEDEAQAA